MRAANEFDIGRRSFLLGWFPFLFHKPEVELCGTRFRLMRYVRRSPRRFLVIHGDEDTAREVLSSYMQDHSGVAWLVTGRDREVLVNGVKIDPNRMFSREGAEINIRSLNPNVDVERVIDTLNLLDRDREKLVRQLTPPRGSRLFALHNNRDYSINDELSASDQVSLKQPELPRNFFLCTQESDYRLLAQSPFNVVLQTSPEPDDGSLSRLAARRGFRYINLECALGDYEGQQERLRWLEDHIP